MLLILCSSLARGGHSRLSNAHSVEREIEEVEQQVAGHIQNRLVEIRPDIEDKLLNDLVRFVLHSRTV